MVISGGVYEISLMNSTGLATLVTDDPDSELKINVKKIAAQNTGLLQSYLMCNILKHFRGSVATLSKNKI